MRPKSVESTALLILLTGFFLLTASSLAFAQMTMMPQVPMTTMPLNTVPVTPTVTTGSALIVPVGPGNPGIMLYPPLSGATPLFIPPGGDSFPVPSSLALPMATLQAVPGVTTAKAVSVSGPGAGPIIVIGGSSSSTVVLPGNDDFPIPNEFIDPSIKTLIGIK
jgi:hypothetical protein